jgi:arylformamidase
MHRALLSAESCIIEGLSLSQVEPVECEFIGLPLRIRGAVGAPARAALRVLS